MSCRLRSRFKPGYLCLPCPVSRLSASTLRLLVSVLKSFPFLPASSLAWACSRLWDSSSSAVRRFKSSWSPSFDDSDLFLILAPPLEEDSEFLRIGTARAAPWRGGFEDELGVGEVGVVQNVTLACSFANGDILAPCSFVTGLDGRSPPPLPVDNNGVATSLVRCPMLDPAAGPPFSPPD